jgi:hypothetical protein
MDVVSKSTGDSYSAAELNQSTNELENSIESTGQTLSSGDVFQVGKTMANYVSHGDFYTDSGAASAYVLTVGSPKQTPTAYVAGFRARFIVGNTNTGASTVNAGALGVKDIKRPDGTATQAGDLTVGQLVILDYDGTDFILRKEFPTASAFSVNKNAVDQTAVVTLTWTKVTFSTEEFDRDNEFTGGTFTPKQAKDYHLSGAVKMNGIPDGSYVSAGIYKNGALYKVGSTVPGGAIYNGSSTISVTVSANGTTDNFELWVLHDSGSDKIIEGETDVTYFTGSKIG